MFHLPDDIVIEIFGLWLSLTELVKLDTAVCNLTTRNVMSIQLSNTEIWLPNVFTRDCSLSTLEWVVAKRIKLKTLMVGHSIIVEASFYSNIRFNCIHHIQIQPDYTMASQLQYSEIINRCVNLRSLETSNALYFTSVNPEIIQNLESIEFGEEYDRKYVDVAQMIRMHCKKLVKFHFWGTSKLISDELIGEILKQNSSTLKDILLIKIPTALFWIAKCPKIEKVTLYGANVTIPYIALLQKHCTKLQKMDIENRFYYYADNTGCGVTIPNYSSDDLASLLALYHNANSMTVNHYNSETREFPQQFFQQNCNSLQDLYLSDCKWVDSTAVAKILKLCHKLQMIHLRNNGYEEENRDVKVISAFSNAKCRLGMIHLGLALPASTLIEIMKRCPYIEYCVIYLEGYQYKADGKILYEFVASFKNSEGKKLSSFNVFNNTWLS